MLKTKAIELLGGSVTAAARTMGITYQAVKKWPDPLTPCITQRVHGVLSMQKAKRKNRITSPMHQSATAAQ